jgi:hypothetical protein
VPDLTPLLDGEFIVNGSPSYDYRFDFNKVQTGAEDITTTTSG